jgi:hypothetical protein
MNEPLNNHRLSPFWSAGIFAPRKERSTRKESDKCMTPPPRKI